MSALPSSLASGKAVGSTLIWQADTDVIISTGTDLSLEAHTEGL